MTGQTYFLPAGGSNPPTAAELEDAIPVSCVLDPDPTDASQWPAHEITYQIPSTWTLTFTGWGIWHIPPLPRTQFPGTAREYRTARRTYSRQVRAHRKASR